MIEALNIWNTGDFPSFEEGAAEPIKKKLRYLKIGSAGHERSECEPGRVKPSKRGQSYPTM
jgi:hypothetical protein